MASYPAMCLSPQSSPPSNVLNPGDYVYSPSQTYCMYFAANGYSVYVTGPEGSQNMCPAWATAATSVVLNEKGLQAVIPGADNVTILAATQFVRDLVVTDEGQVIIYFTTQQIDAEWTYGSGDEVVAAAAPVRMVSGFETTGGGSAEPKASTGS
jgi:hypothetical protein